VEIRKNVADTLPLLGVGHGNSPDDLFLARRPSTGPDRLHGTGLHVVPGRERRFLPSCEAARQLSLVKPTGDRLVVEVDSYMLTCQRCGPEPTSSVGLAATSSV
jgi:hypothetical protein